MKKIFFIKSLIYILCFGIFFLALGVYVVINEPQKIGAWIFLLLISVMFFQVSWVKVIIKEDYIIFVNGFKREKIFYCDILGLRMKYCKPRFARGTIPAIIIRSNNKPFPLYFRRFKEENIITIVETIKHNNEKITLCHNIKRLIKQQDSRLMEKFRKDEKVLMVFVLGVIILVIGINLFINFFGKV